MKRSDAFFFHLRNYGVYYLGFTIAAVVVGAIGWRYQTKLREEEKVDVLVISKYANDASFQNKFQKQLDKAKPKDLVTIEYRFVTENTQEMNSVLGTYGEVTCDVFILPESVYTSWGTTSLLPLNENACSSLFGDGLTYYQKDDINYGIALTSSILPDDQTYYVSFGKSSLHLGALSSQEDDADIVLARTLL